MTQVTHLGLEHQHQLLVVRERLEPLALELPLVELDPLVALRIGHVGVGVILAIPRRVGGRSLHREGDLRTATRIDGLIDRVAAQHQLQREHVGRTVAHDERRPVLQVVALVARLTIEGEVGVGPIHALTQTESQTVGAEVHRRGLPYVVGVVLLRDVSRDGERIGLLATKPGVGERKRERLVVGTVGLAVDRQTLVLSHRVGAPCTLLEGILDREVVEGYTDRTHEGARSPTTGNVKLVRGLLLERPIHIHQLVRYGLDVGHDGLGVEVTHRAEHADRLHEHRAVVELTRAGVELATNHLVVHAHVARDAHLVDRKLLTLENLNLQVD